MSVSAAVPSLGSRGSPIPGCEVRSNGKSIVGVTILSIQTAAAINRIPRATVVLAASDQDPTSFSNSDNQTFQPGAVLELRLGYEDQLVPVLEGPVVRHRLIAGPTGARLVLDIRHPAVRLTRGREYRIWTDAPDKQALGALVEAAGLTLQGLPDVAWKHPQLVQYGCSDWDFLLQRTDALGRFVVLGPKAVQVQTFPIQGAATHSLSNASGLVLDFDVEADVLDQYDTVVTRRLDAEQLTLQTARSAAETSPDSPGRWSRSAKEPLGGALTLGDAVPRPADEAQAWADAEAARRRAGFLRGTVTVAGDSDLQVGQVVDLVGFGAAFSGKALVTGVDHAFTSSGWRTVVQVGAGAERVAERSDVPAPRAGGLLAPVSGLQVGIVTEVGAAGGDQAELVQVALPSLGAEVRAWARLALPGLGTDHGLIFRPYVGDEVVVGFFSDDPRYPVVLGGMFGKQNPAPDAFGAKKETDTWAVVSKKGSVISITEADDPVVRVATPKGNSVELSDVAGSITIKDQHGNSLVLDSSGVAVTAKGQFQVKADGAVKISGASVDLG